MQNEPTGARTHTHARQDLEYIGDLLHNLINSGYFDECDCEDLPCTWNGPQCAMCQIEEAIQAVHRLDQLLATAGAIVFNAEATNGIVQTVEAFRELRDLLARPPQDQTG